MYKRFLKPLLDVICSLIFILLFWWLYIIVAILVRVKLGSPVLFTQDRPGMIDPGSGESRIFKLYKFRSMTDERDSDGNLLSDEVRLTPFGKFLRSTSLDELPEILFNILIKRDMSIVGPRPLLVRYLPRYNAHQARRHEVKPGLTGLAQARGRNAISWEEKFDLDVEYVDHMSFFLDLKILFWTLGTVLKREGVSSETSVTMEEFMGTKQ